MHVARMASQLPRDSGRDSTSGDAMKREADLAASKAEPEAPQGESRAGSAAAHISQDAGGQVRRGMIGGSERLLFVGSFLAGGRCPGEGRQG